MCSPQSASYIAQVVSDFVNQNRLFTAWDVTQAVRQLAKAAGVSTERHGDLKGTIHSESSQYIQTGLYDRQLQDIGAPERAFVYFPSGSDPSTYVAGNINSKPVSKPAAKTVAVTAQKPIGNDGYATDSRHTLCVPASLIKQIGLKSGSSVHVCGYTNASNVPALAISANYDPTLPLLTKYTVDAYNNVRITSKTLVAGGLCSDPSIETFDFELDGSVVLVYKH